MDNNKETNMDNNKEDTYNLVPTRFEWPHDGSKVVLTGSFCINHWNGRIPLTQEKDTKVWATTIPLSAGYTYEYKYIVDDNWNHDDSKEHISIEGFTNNFITVENPALTRFEWKYEGSSVELAGSFNNWAQIIPLERETVKDDQGTRHVWATTIPLKRGETYEYKFIIDHNNWYYDLDKLHIETSPGIYNNLITVPLSNPKSVRFEWRHGGNQVLVTGSFVSWKRWIPLNRDSESVWATTIPLRPGNIYEYKYQIDGQWRNDPLVYIKDEGHGNNIIKVPIDNTSPCPCCNTLLPPPASKIILMGNSSSGKTTILNSLIQSPVFKSGPTENDLTSSYQIYTVGDIGYIDTPGLSDSRLRQTAAEQIHLALSEGGNFHLCFVITLEEDRIRPDDLVTAFTILYSMRNIQNLDYGIIVNKVSPKIKEIGPQALLSEINGFLPKTQHLFLFEENTEAIDRENALLPRNEELFQFLMDIGPNAINVTNIEGIKIDLYENIKSQLE